jgi:hypothetical protein
MMLKSGIFDLSGIDSRQRVIRITFRQRIDERRSSFQRVISPTKPTPNPGPQEPNQMKSAVMVYLVRRPALGNIPTMSPSHLRPFDLRLERPETRPKRRGQEGVLPFPE